MPFSGVTFSKIYSWLGDLINNDKIFNSRLDDEFGGLATGLTAWLNDTNGTLTTGGSANAQTVTTNVAYAALVTGLRLVLKAGFTSTAAATLNVTPAGGSAFGAKSIRIFTVSGGEGNPAANQIRAGGIYEFVYDTAANAAAGAWILTNPTAGTVGAAALTSSAMGFGGPAIINGDLSVTANVITSNAATFAIKTLAGADPSASDPVYVIFRGAGDSAGDYAVLTLTAAVSLTVSSGSTLGTVSGLPFRIWIVGFNDAGTFRLGVIHCQVGGANPTKVTPIWEALGQSSTAEGGAGGADNAGVFYTGTAVSAKLVRILGYAEWHNGLTPAGTWTSGPGYVQQFGPGIHKPGERVQLIRNPMSQDKTTTSTTYVASTNTIDITLTSSANLVHLWAVVDMNSGAAGDAALAKWSRGTTNNTNIIGDRAAALSAVGVVKSCATLEAFDRLTSVSAQTYAIQVATVASNTMTLYGAQVPNMMNAEEIMG